MQSSSLRHTAVTWRRNCGQMLDIRVLLFGCCGVVGDGQINDVRKLLMNIVSQIYLNIHLRNENTHTKEVLNLYILGGKWIKQYYAIFGQFNFSIDLAIHHLFRTWYLNCLKINIRWCFSNCHVQLHKCLNFDVSFCMTHYRCTN
jgi:hypothetical protein